MTTFFDQKLFNEVRAVWPFFERVKSWNNRNKLGEPHPENWQREVALIYEGYRLAIPGQFIQSVDDAMTEIDDNLAMADETMVQLQEWTLARYITVPLRVEVKALIDSYINADGAKGRLDKVVKQLVRTIGRDICTAAELAELSEGTNARSIGASLKRLGYPRVRISSTGSIQHVWLINNVSYWQTQSVKEIRFAWENQAATTSFW